VKGRVMTRQQVRGADFQEQLGRLKAKLALLEDGLADVRRRIQELRAARSVKRHAAVDPLRCTGCRVCEQVCPVGAIRVTYIAQVDKERCTGCGTCVQNCPRGALSLVRR